MKPERTNYEIWLIDYLDGRLDEDQVKQLLSFLDQNPDIKKEFAEFSQIPLTSGLLFSGKSQLKKSVTEIPESQFDLLCIAASEGDATEEHKGELESIILTDSDRQKDFELIKKLKLISTEIKYPYKSSLKHLTVVQKVLRLSFAGISAAAAIALLILLINTSRVNNNDGIKQTISVNTPVNTREVTLAEKITVVADSKEKIKENRPVSKISVKNTLIFSDTVRTQIIHPDMPVNEQIENMVAITSFDFAKVDFIQEVKILQTETTGSLILLNQKQISVPEIFERHSINEYLAGFFREKILKSKTPETGTLKAYEVADAGILGLNRLLGWDMSLKQTRDDKGELKSLYFSSKIIRFNAPVKKGQESL